MYISGIQNCARLSKYNIFRETKAYVFKDTRMDYAKEEIVNSIVGEILGISPSILDYARFKLRDHPRTTHCFVHKKLSEIDSSYRAPNREQEYRELIDRSSPYGRHKDHFHMVHNVLIDNSTDKLYFIDMVDFEFSRSYYLIT